MFESTKQDLKRLLENADQCDLQLPDFQRDWVWTNRDIATLLGSVTCGFPVGSILTLRTGGDFNFKPRPIAGVSDRNKDPEELLLDGQQRITSLYKTLYCQEPVLTTDSKGYGVKRFYYLNIKNACSPESDFDDLIVSVPESRIKKGQRGEIEIDLSSPEREYEEHMFPVNCIFNWHDWVYGWRDYWRNHDVDVHELDKAFVKGPLDLILRYEMPIIRLSEKNSRQAICTVFEKVNVGGKKLDTFELLTAIYAADRFDLRHDWLGIPRQQTPGRRQRIQGLDKNQDVLKDLASTDFLQACTVLHTRAIREQAAKAGKEGRELPQVSCKKETILRLPVEGYRAHADALEEGFRQAGYFLNQQKIVWKSDIPYPPQVVVLAATFAILGKKLHSAAARGKLEQWFWAGALGELFGSAAETKIARDVPQLVSWIEGGERKPETIRNAYFQKDRLDQLRVRNSAAYKGMHALLMRHGCRDFISGKEADLMTLYQEKIDIHHIFPRKWCQDNRVPDTDFEMDSIINKSPLSVRSNRMIGGDAPSIYLQRIQDEQGLSAKELDDILRSHLIEPEHLRNDDFEAFYQARKTALAEIAAQAMGSEVLEESEVDEPHYDTPDAVEEDYLEEAV